MRIISSVRTISAEAFVLFDALCQFVIPTSGKHHHSCDNREIQKSDSPNRVSMSEKNIALLALHSYTSNFFSIGIKLFNSGVGKTISRLTTILLCGLLIAVIRMTVFSPSYFSFSAIGFVLTLGLFFNLNARHLSNTNIKL
jgi:hypothetical protein